MAKLGVLMDECSIGNAKESRIIPTSQAAAYSLSYC